MAILLAGCSARTLDVGWVEGPGPDGVPVVMDFSGLGLTLSRAIVGDKVDYERLLRDRQPLDRFLALVAQVGPQTTPSQFPDRSARLAYAINCYNATVLRSVLELARGGVISRRAPFDLAWRFRFRIDGRLQSPADLRRTAEDLAGDDWRVRLALCDCRQVGPPMTRRVFLGGMLDAQLNEVARAALRSSQVVRIDHGERKQLLVWRGLYEIRDRLVLAYEDRLDARNAGLLNVLLEWSDRPRREELNGAVGYEVAMMPPNDALNALEPTSEEERGLLSVLESIQSFSFLRPH
jgi:hypothetical protein